MTPEPALEGTCKLAATPRHDLLEVVATEYTALAGEYGPGDVLVLKRHPAGLERVRDQLARTDAADGTPSTPRLESLPEHASKVLEESDPTIERLEYEERIELLSLVIAGTKRDVPAYLERARDHESFARDVGQLLLEATRQGIRYEDLAHEGADLHECLAFCYAMNDRFHEVLGERGLIERADVIPRVVSLLADEPALRTRIASSYDAVLALEFEEFRRLDREYLSLLTREPDTTLVCLGERHASVERTRVEPEPIDDVVGAIPDLSVEELEVPDSSTSPPHAGITRYLASGRGPSVAPDVESHDGSCEDSRSDADTGDTNATDETDGAKPATDAASTRPSARRIRAETFREQVREVAAEIQYLLERHDGWTHDDVAVAVPSVERVPETRRALRDAGIPTATIGTPSLSEDPAVNELYAVVSYNCDRDVERATERLAARVPDVSPSFLERCSDGSVSRALERWILSTDLKRRIAENEPWVDAAEQFQGVRRVLEIAQFVETTDLVASDWEGLARMLRRTIRYDAPYVHAVETRSPTGGVTVCSIADLAFDSREAVFLLDLTDDTYPGRQHLTQLFPTTWVTSMAHFPAVTQPTPETVARTFAPASTAPPATAPTTAHGGVREASRDTDSVAGFVADPSADSDTPTPRVTGEPFEAYHAQRSRRALALGTRAARSRCYLCSYERESGGLGRTHDQSRYLTELEAVPGIDFEDVDAVDRTAAIHGEATAIEALLAEPWGELERILREASTGGEADLAETEALFQEIEVVLESASECESERRDEPESESGAGIDEDLADAVRSHFEFAAGEVLRDD